MENSQASDLVPKSPVTLPSNQFEQAALQLLEAAIAQFSTIGVTALMNLLTSHINHQVGK